MKALEIYIRQIVFIVCGVTCWQMSFGQRPDKAIAIAHYDYKHMMDTTERGKINQEEMMLVLGQHASIFSSAEYVRATHDFQLNPTKVTASGSTIIQATVNRYYDPQELYFFHQEQKSFVVEKLINSYLYEKEYPFIEWYISTETRIINEFDCQKAMTNYKGRDWEVWFTEAIPFAAGPWQLCGLPGLIVEAVDAGNEVSFKLNSFEMIENEVHPYFEADNPTIRIPDKVNRTPVIKTTENQVNRLWTAYHKNPSEFVSAQIRASGGIIDNIVHLESLALKPVCNNPIALDD